jgi:hypothetical protein
LFVKEATVAYRVAKNNSKLAVHRRFVRIDRVSRNQSGGTVGVAEILSQIDREIAQLQQARALLAGQASPAKTKKVKTPTNRKKTRKKRNLTPEGRKRIAEAVKRRWAEQKKAAGSK